LHKVKVVTGKAGIWCGIAGEYWWIPGFADVSWIRSLLRTTPQETDKNSTKFLLQNQPLPVKVIEAKPNLPVNKPSKILLDGKLGQENGLELKLNFAYKNSIFNPNGARFAYDEKEIWKRAVKLEKRVINELLMFGFKQDPIDPSKFYLGHPVAVATFFENFIREWKTKRRKFLLSSNLLSLLNDTIPEVEISARILEEAKNDFTLNYSINPNDENLSWQNLEKNINKNSNAIITTDNKLMKIPTELANFIKTIKPTLSSFNKKESTFKLNKVNIPLWVKLTEKLPSLQINDFTTIFPNSTTPFTDSILVKNKKIRFNATLRNYQQHGVNWLFSMTNKNFNVILADEMGLGKTIQIIAMLSIEKITNKPKKPSLVLAPTSLIDNWIREFREFSPDIKIAKYYDKYREDVINNIKEYDIIITSYNIAKLDIETISDLKFNYLILDEAQNIKNPFTINAKTCKMISADKKVVLTGTPIENSLNDLWSIFDFLNPKVLGTLNKFQNEYDNIVENKDKLNELLNRVSPFILRRKKEDVCQELPEKIERHIYTSFNKDELTAYDKYYSQAQKVCKDYINKKDKTNKLDIFTALLRLRQISCNINVLEEYNGITSSKFEVLKELVYEIIENDRKVLIFSQFTSILQIIREWLKEEKLNFEYLDGSTQNRQQVVDTFNDNKEKKIFLLSLKAGGTGLNLTSADSVIIYDPWWNPAIEDQAIDRTHRIGQDKTVNVYKLIVENSIEEKVLKLREHKKELADTLLDETDTPNIPDQILTDLLN
jgi:SNF2 family DNA or RNA helicase